MTLQKRRIFKIISFIEIVSITMTLSNTTMATAITQQKVADTNLSENNAWNGEFDYNWEGKGTSDDPYLISSANELAGLANRINKDDNTYSKYRGKVYSLTKDINLNCSKEMQWVPIGDREHAFSGVFRGNGHKISGIYIDSDSDDLGFFGCIDNAKIHDLIIEDSYIKGNDYIGSIVGYAVSESTYAKLLIENCINYATIEGNEDVGGIIGHSYMTFQGKKGETRIRNCCNMGKIKGNDNVGGIVGRTYSAANDLSEWSFILQCYNSGNIASENGTSGGITGYDFGTCKVHSYISNCYNDGKVAGKDAGGIVGYSFKSSYSMLALTNCYNIGEIQGENILSDIIGGEHGGVNISNSYYCSENLNDQFGNSCVDREMKNMETYNNWDFETVWKQDLGYNNGYPYLQWADELINSVLYDGHSGNITGRYNHLIKQNCSVTDDICINSKLTVDSNTILQGKSLQIKQGGELIVKGEAYFENISVEGKGKLTVMDGGYLNTVSIVAKGGAFWNNGGCLEFHTGAFCISDNISLKNDATMNMYEKSQVVVRQNFEIDSSTDSSQFYGGDLFVGKQFIQSGNKRNFVATDKHHIIFYINSSQPLKCKSDQYKFGSVYVVDSETGKAIQNEISTKNIQNRCNLFHLTSTNRHPWTYTVTKTTYDPYDYINDVEWQKGLLDSYKNIANSGSYSVNCSKLTIEQSEAINKLTSIWMAALKMPLYDDLLDFGFKDYCIRIRLTLEDNKEHDAMLQCNAWGIGDYANWGTVYLIIDGDTSNKYLVGFSASGSIDKYAEQAGEYVRDECCNQYMSFLTGIHNDIWGESVGWDSFTKFLSKMICQKYVTNGDVSIQDTIGNAKGNISKWVKIIDTGIELDGKFDDIVRKTRTEKSSNIVLNSKRAVPSKSIQLAGIGKTTKTTDEIKIADECLLNALKKQFGTNEDGGLNIENIETISELDLSNSHIKDLTGLDIFSNLIKLTLKNNEIEDITVLKNLNKLNYLDISGNVISDISSLRYLNNLNELYAQANIIDNVTPLNKLHELKILKISDNQIENISDLSDLSALKNLQLSGNKISNNINILNGLSDLEILDVSNCEISSIDAFNNKNLKTLCIATNNIESLSGIENLTNLEKLNASNNNIGDITALSNLQKLCELDIKNNKLSQIGTLSAMESIYTIDLSDNLIKDNELMSLVALDHLENLDVSGNIIFGFKSFLQMKNLKNLNISKTQLDETDKALLEEWGITTTLDEKPITPYAIYYINNIEMQKGESIYNQLTSYPCDADLTQVKYSSSSSSVVSVSNDGVVTGIKAGTAKILAKFNDDIQAEYRIVVKDETGGETNRPDATVSPKPTENPNVSASAKPNTTAKPDTTSSPKPTNKPDVVSSPKPTDGTNATNIPLKGTILTDSKKAVSYKVTAQGKSVAFYKANNRQTAKIVIPATVTINDIEYKVTAISDSAFSGCKKLKSISIGKYVTSIGDKAFFKCTSLKKIIIPASVKKIGKKAFYGCKKLKSITIKTKKLKIKSVGAQAFKGIYKKAVIKVPKKQKKAYTKWLRKKGITKKMKIK